VAAYIIVEVETTDEALIEYRNHTPGSPSAASSLRGGKTTRKAAGAPRSSLEFPSYEKAEEFYHSDHYKPILAMRLKAGKSKAILVDGHNG
jgi:uncharacterized protein (DUF1330 family)